MEAHLEQGSEAWKEYRRSRLGASDIAAVLGISPYSTPLQLWEEKTNRRAPQPMSPAMRFGHDNEEMVRKLYEEKSGVLFLPNVVTHPDYPWMMASLDGLNFSRDKALEIKCCNVKVFELAQKGEAVPHYYAQMMAQFACVPSLEEIHYVCLNKGVMAVVIVKRNEEFIAEMIEQCKAFYKCMVEDYPPSLSVKDYIELEDYDFLDAAEKYKTAKRALDVAKKEEEICKAALLEHTDDGNCCGGGLRITRVTKQTTDYKKACEDASIDLTKYAKTPSSYWKITIEKKDE